MFENLLRSLTRLRGRLPFGSGDSPAGFLLRGSAVAFICTALGQVLAFGLQLIFARRLEIAEFGSLSYMMSWLSVGLILGKLGFDTALVRFIAGYTSRQEPELAAGAWHYAWRASLRSSLLIAPVFAAIALAMAGRESLRTGILVVFVALVPVATLGELAASALRGFKRVGSALLGDSLLRPLVAAAAFLAAGACGIWSATSALASYALGTLASAILAAVLLRGSLGIARPAVVDPRLERIWLKSAATLMFANAFLILLYTVDTILLGSLQQVAEAGKYAVASRVAILVLFVMNAIQFLGGPMLAEAYASGERDVLRRVIRILNLFASVAAIPIAFLVWLGAPWILGIFGPGFSPASPALRVLLLMQVFNVLTGPVGVILSMTGRQRELAALLGAAFAIHLLLCLILIPQHGALGAAWSAFVAHALWNLAGVATIRSKLRIDCTLFDWLKSRDFRTVGS